MNKSKVQLEAEQIDNYIKRHKWQCKETGTGLRYFIYHKTNGDSAKKGMFALINFSVTLLNGDTAYVSEKGKPSEFLIGMDNVESGLHEGVQLMRKGEKAKLILPSHLAHGLIGDLNKIPPRSTIVYDIELVDLK